MPEQYYKKNINWTLYNAILDKLTTFEDPGNIITISKGIIDKGIFHYIYHYITGGTGVFNTNLDEINIILSSENKDKICFQLSYLIHDGENLTPGDTNNLLKWIHTTSWIKTNTELVNFKTSLNNSITIKETV